MLTLLLCTEWTQILVFRFKKKTKNLKLHLFETQACPAFQLEKKKVTKLHVVYEGLKLSIKPDEKISFQI